LCICWCTRVLTYHKARMYDAEATIILLDKSIKYRLYVVSRCWKNNYWAEC